ncbi:MAG: NADH-quinone oxidoreductase subunit C [Acidobacteria bacterium]|nr:NADH-quinone oxidoreductase subunit C [Acidobacteriota bacterium]
MDEEKEKSKEQEKKPTSEEAPSPEKPKKQPKVWAKPGAPAAGPARPGVGGAGESKPPAAAQASPAPPKPAASAPPRKSPVETPTYLDISQDPLVSRIQEKFPGAVLAAQSFLGQKILTVDPLVVLPLCDFLKHDPECNFDLLEDVTAVDFPERDKRFVVVYQLCSIRRNVQVRLKCNIAENDKVASVTSVWSVANWLEREVYDMFGIIFLGHPDLRRILLPEDWVGHPLRKDYDVHKQDEDWIQRHLQIRK